MIQLIKQAQQHLHPASLPPTGAPPAMCATSSLPSAFPQPSLAVTFGLGAPTRFFFLHISQKLYLGFG